MKIKLQLFDWKMFVIHTLGLHNSFSITKHLLITSTCPHTLGFQISNTLSNAIKDFRHPGRSELVEQNA